MHGSLKNLGFDNIRTWDGSQDRAFEELSFQLLKDDVPEGVQAIRTGNPDGGVEWYVEFPDGKQWGWQAKDVKGIEALLSGMTKSVKQVASERPQLVRLTFVISRNLNTGTAGGQRKSERSKYLDKIETWKREIPGAGRIEYRLIQESDLLDKLAHPQHQGRRWFWWEQASLGIDWLRKFHKEQSDAAGDKYRPDLQVDLPIADDLKALGFSQSVLNDYLDLRKRALKAIDRLRTPDTDNDELTSAWQTTCELAQQVAVYLRKSPSLAWVVSSIELLERAASSCLAAVMDAEDLAIDYRQNREELPPKAADNRKRSLDALLFEARSLRSEISELQKWLSQTSIRAAGKRLYFLTGAAGSGKTHLFLDTARLALDENRPAVVLFGAQFGDGNLWASICDQLGLAPLGKEVLLSAMDSAAEAAGIDSRRFVIMVDALNETAVPGFWQTHLPILRAALTPYPHLALAVSCRDTYLEVTDPHERSRYVLHTHPGFAGCEVEATQKYFDHYGLQTPRIPLLVPEFTVPLFLRLYCESLSNGNSTAPLGHEGRVEIFERYLNTKLNHAGQNAFPAASTDFEIDWNRNRARTALNALLDGMAESESEWLTATLAEDLVASTVEGDRVRATKIIGSFISEGILNREPLYFWQKGEGSGIRISFQAFADFLLLRRKLERSANPLEDQSISEWLMESASRGILEAATVLFPEAYGIELPDFLGLSVNDLDAKAVRASDDYSRTIRAEYVYRSLAKTLPYRASSAIGERTIELLNDALRSVLTTEDFYQILFASAPQPGNLLNGDGLHRHLAGMKMPKRDATFGFAVYDEVGNESSPAMRLARWAAQGPYPSYPSEVIELSAIPLVWLFSSPNRYLRDWVTKALVQLLHGHLDVMRALFERFWSVDDPYVVQRLVVTAYGSIMRGGSLNPQQAAFLARSILEHAFVRPVSPDELMLDAARGIVEWAVAHGILPETSLKATKRPYGLKRPGNPPSQAAIDRKYDSDRKLPDSESYGTIYSSLFGLADFGRYVVDSDLRHFSRFPIGHNYPEPESEKPRFVKSRWNKFIQSVTPQQMAVMAEAMESESIDASEAFDRLLGGSLDEKLTREQRVLFASTWESPRRHHPMDDAFPGDRARRWIFMRTLSLGWAPELFGIQDRMIAYRDRAGRSGHKAERWGKKYQWMAFHELLARVADNYQPLRGYGEVEPYDGPQQIIAMRDLDPSLPPVSYRDFSEGRAESVRTWRPAPIRFLETLAPRLEFARYLGDATRFVADLDSEPLPDRTAEFTDEHGDAWIALSGYEVQREHFNNWDVENLQQTVWLSSGFVRTRSPASAAKRMMKAWQSNSRDFEEPEHVDCCFAGEIGWLPRFCPNMPDEPRTVGEGRSFVEFIDTTEVYRWEGVILDCSIEDSVSAFIPSTYIQQRTNLRMTAAGPSWVDDMGRVVAVNRDFADDRWRALFVRVDWLHRFLQQEDLELVVLVMYERLLLDPKRSEIHARATGWSAAYLNNNGQLVRVGEPIRVVEQW